MKVEGISSVIGTELAPTETTPAPTDGAVDFGDLLARGVENAAQLEAEATRKTAELSAGKSDDIHGTLISVKEAEISMKLVGTIRNRLLDAFHELWRINL
jgi:flagellar hook-basal body complex protein FliE